MYCIECKQEIENDSKFCRFCGVDQSIKTQNDKSDLKNDLKEIMKKHNITSIENNKYTYLTYKYDRLEDAINYAEQTEKRNT